MASAVTNRSSMRLPLPTVLFEKLLDSNFEPCLAKVLAFDPAAHSAMVKVRDMGESDFQALLDLEACPGLDREGYIEKAAKGILVDDVAWQFEALQRGFDSALRRDTLHDWAVTADDLREMISGLETRNLKQWP